MKRMLVITLALCMIVVASPITAFAAGKIVSTQENFITLDSWGTRSKTLRFTSDSVWAPDFPVNGYWTRAYMMVTLAFSIYIGYTQILKPNQMGGDENKLKDSISAVESTGPVGITNFVDTTDPMAVTGSFEPTEPIASAIPCTGLFLEGSVGEMTFAGQYRRISVRVTPENTTDQVTYISGDPNVVTVDDKGHVIAVGEGQTVIVISCGSKRIETPIVVKYAESATDPSAATAGTDSAVATPAPGNFLTLKRNGKTVSEVTIGKLGVYITLELDNNIPAENVKWSTSDSSVATVYNGNVTAIGRGNCVIRAEYNGQTAECVVRVK